MRSKASSLMVVACIGISICGCADLQVFRVKGNGPNTDLVGKIPYYLPRTAINLTGNLTITSCTPVSLKGGGYSARLGIEANLAPTATIEADPNYQYYVSYENSRSWTKETNFTVDTYSNKTLQNFNSTINDQAGPIGIAAILTSVQIAGAVALPMVVATKEVKPEMPKFCSAEVLDGLSEVEQNQKALKDAKKMPSSDAQIQAITAAQSAIAAAQKSHHLIRTMNYRWTPTPPLDAKNGSSEEFQDSVDLRPIFTEWLSSDVGQPWLMADHHPSSDVYWEELRDPVVLSLSIDRWSLGANAPIGNAGEVGDKADGLVIRDPASGFLRVCRNTCIASNGPLLETTNDIAPRLNVSLPQFGRILVLPQHSVLFENSTLTVKLNADGAISSIGYHSASSAAAGLGTATGAANSASGAITARNTAIAAVNGAKVAQAQYADTVNKSLADCLASQAAIIKAGGEPPLSCQ